MGISVILSELNSLKQYVARFRILYFQVFVKSDVLLPNSILFERHMEQYENIFQAFLEC